MPNWIGDAVMATPILQDLHHKFPTAKLTLLCENSIASLLGKDPHLTEIIHYTKSSGWMHRAGKSDMIETLSKGNYDTGILLTNSFSSSWWFWRSNVQNKIGFANFFRSFFLDVALPYPKDMEKRHLVSVYKELLVPLGIPISSTQPKLYLGHEDREFQKSFFKLNGIKKDDILIGVNPGASYGSAKCWPADRFREITLKLLENPQVMILYFGDLNGASLVKEICHEMPGRVMNLAGKTTLRELMALIERCSIFLSNDSGPMHIASAFEIPLVALFGSTNSIKTGPYNGGKIISKKVECSPCYKRACPIADFPCMTKISVNEVYHELTHMIEKWNTK